MWCAVNWSNSIERAKSWVADHGFSWIPIHLAGRGSRGWFFVLFFGDWNICVSRNGLNISFDWFWGTYYDVLKFIEPCTARVRNKAPSEWNGGQGVEFNGPVKSISIIPPFSDCIVSRHTYGPVIARIFPCLKGTWASDSMDFTRISHFHYVYFVAMIKSFRCSLARSLGRQLSHLITAQTSNIDIFSFHILPTHRTLTDETNPRYCTCTLTL